MDRAALIARKHEIIAQIQRARRELEHERAKENRGKGRRCRQLENRLDAFMAEEYRLRLAIDRSPR